MNLDYDKLTIKNILTLVKELKLQTHEDFDLVPLEEISKMHLGCGPGALGDKIVPDSFWGLNMYPACFVHDIDYYLSETAQEKFAADLRFLNNCLIIIQKNYIHRITDSPKLKVIHIFLVFLRSRRAMTYFNAVTIGGGKSFFKSQKKFFKKTVGE